MQCNTNLKSSNKMLRPEISTQVNNLPSTQPSQHAHSTKSKPLHALICALVRITQLLFADPQVIHFGDNIADHFFDSAQIGLDRLELFLDLDAGPVTGVGADFDIEFDFAGGVGDATCDY